MRMRPRVRFLRIQRRGSADHFYGSPEEHAYFDQLEAGLSEFAGVGESVYVETASDAHTEADRVLIVTVSEALELLASVIDSVDPPGPLAADHERVSVRRE